MDKFNKKTIVTVSWHKEKGSSSMSTKISGDKMPEDIKTMLLNDLIANEKYYLRLRG